MTIEELTPSIAYRKGQKLPELFSIMQPTAVDNGLSIIRSIAGEAAFRFIEKDSTRIVEACYVKLIHAIMRVLKAFKAPLSQVEAAQKKRMDHPPMNLNRSVNLVQLYAVVANSGYNSREPFSSEELSDTLCSMVSVITTYFRRVKRLEWFYEQAHQGVHSASADRVAEPVQSAAPVRPVRTKKAVAQPA